MNNIHFCIWKFLITCGINLDILLSPKYLSDTAMCYTYTVLLRDSRKRGEIEGTIKAAATYSHV